MIDRRMLERYGKRLRSSGMAVNGSYRNGSRFRTAVSDEDVGQDDFEDEPRDEIVRIPKLRSKIVRASYSDDEEEEGPGDDALRRPAGTPSPGGGAAESHFRERKPLYDSRREDSWREEETGIGRHTDGSRGASIFHANDVVAEGRGRRSSEEDFGGRRRSEGLDRDREQARVRIDRGDRDGRGTALPKDRAPIAHVSPVRREFTRERDYGNRRDADASVGKDAFVDRHADGLSKGKGKRDASQSPVGMRGSQVHQRERERGAWPRLGRDFQDHHDAAEKSHHVDKIFRRDRDDSLSPADSRDPGARPRALPDFRQDRNQVILQDDGRIDRKRGTVRSRNEEREKLPESSLPELYSVHRGTVHSIRAFGIFVKINGYRNHGLVHLSQVSDHEITNRSDSDAAKVDALSSIFSEGEQVWVKIISIKAEDDRSVKVGCSIKYVSQGDGRDLDPNNLQLEKLQSKPGWKPPLKLELDAVYNVVCSRCGGHGHLKTECYSGGTQYALLKDDDLEENGPRGSKPTAPKSSYVGSSSRARAPVAPMGRGRAMVQPAWMKHGVGIGGDQEGVTDDHRTVSVLPDRPKTLSLQQGSGAASSKPKERKSRKRGEGRHRSKHHRKENRNDGKEDRHKRKKRYHSDAEDQGRRKRKRNRH